VECFDFDSDGDHDLIGGFTTTVSEMMQAATKPVRYSHEPITVAMLHETLSRLLIAGNEVERLCDDKRLCL